MEIVHCNIIEYSEAWQQQKQYFERLLVAPDSAPEVVMFCEHPHVYTLGKSGHANNLLVNDEFLSNIGATYFKTDRGGDITYHGYGQLVVYPILNLQRRGYSLKEYIYILEQTIIETVGEFGIQAYRLPGATGVWIDGVRKIAAIGVKASRYITMHGIALNVSTDLSYFNHINPCGFVDKGVTSIESETGQKIAMKNVVHIFETHFQKHFATTPLTTE